MTVLIGTIVLVIFLGAVFSAVEAAIFSITLPKAQVLKKQGKLGAAALVEIREHMSRPVTMLVIGSNIVTIVGSALVGSVATTAFGDTVLGVVLAIVTFLIIVFGEIFPKVIGEQYAATIARFAARPILTFDKNFESDYLGY